MYVYKYVDTFFFTDQKLSFDLPEIDDLEYPSLEIFIALSQLVTFHNNLDEISAQKLFKIFLEEPGGADNIIKTYGSLKNLIGEGTKQGHLLEGIKTGNIGKTEKWFAQHLLTTWYTGIYYAEGQEPVRLLHEDALVWKPLKGLLPIPFVENIDFGLWAKHPRDLA